MQNALKYTLTELGKQLYLNFLFKREVIPCKQSLLHLMGGNSLD